MPTVLITGAGRGLGFEFARQYAADGWSVIATLRDTKQGAALAALGKSVEIHQLEVTDLKAIQRLADELNGRAMDILLCNAGVIGLRTTPTTEADYQAWEQTLRVNAIAPHALAQAFAEHVAAGQYKLMAMISSQMGSLTRTKGNSTVYRSSKAALNMVARNLSIELEPRGISVVMFHPGWVRTDMGGAGAAISPEESVTALRNIIARLGPGDSGSYLSFDGSVIPW
jgi:NAD(P)-dependent dehydrogenase (short-subunit alcohol dehydrogenase family)